MSDISTCMHILLLVALHLMRLKTSPPAGGFAMIGCWQSRERILMFASLAESSSSIFIPSTCTTQKWKTENEISIVIFEQETWTRQIEK